MKDFFKSIKLIREQTITLNCPTSYFLKMLTANMAPDDFGFFEAFTKGPHFKGKVTGNEFRIRQRQQFFASRGKGFAVIDGSARDRNEKAVIEMEISGVRRSSAGFLFLIVFYLVAIVAMITSSANPEEILPVLIGQFIFMLAVFYFVIRNIVRVATSEIEKDLYYLVKDYTPGT